MAELDFQACAAADAARQSSALDALNAAFAVCP